MRVLQERNSLCMPGLATQQTRKPDAENGVALRAEAVANARGKGTEALQQLDVGNAAQAGSAALQAAAQTLPTFGMQQVLELYRNSLKLASENKITKDNTWGLDLIDHMSDLVKPSDEEQGQTNFQRASCTLDAGVKIYSYRVDSVHNSIYKTLGGLNRTAAPSQQDDAGEDVGDEADSESGPKKRRAGASDQASDPSATLEPTVENLNVKKFDLTFAVDPLFHKTSAQFDEGGAKGLLLNNLSVYHGCEIVFDSSEVPDQAMTAATHVPDVQLDCSAWQGQIAAALAAPANTPITPSLPLLTALLGPRSAGEADRAYAQEAEALADQVPTGRGETSSSFQGLATQSADITADDTDSQADMTNSFGAFDDYDDGAADDDHPNDGAAGDAGFEEGELGDDSGWGDTASSPQHSLQTQQGGSAMQTSDHSQLPEGLQLMLQGTADSQEEGSSALSRGSMWAGASHWRYTTPANSQAESKPANTKRRPKAEYVVDFENLTEPPAGTFTLAPHKDISLKATSAVNTLLPPDHHYKVSMLRQLFLKPLSAVRRDPKDAAGQSTPGFDFGGASCGDADDGDDGGFGDSAGWGDTDFGNEESIDTGDLLEAPRKVEKISVPYSKASKQVDVRALKETLWHSMGSVQEASSEQVVSFQDLIADIPAFGAAGRAEDLSVHLCFICLLHLANEHGLAINGSKSLDQLVVSHPAV